MQIHTLTDIYLRFIPIFTSHLRLFLPIGLLPVGPFVDISKTQIHSSVLAILVRSVYIILLVLITLNVLGLRGGQPAAREPHAAF